MDQYWNYIATPLFLFVLLFGVFVLFRVSKTQFVGAAPIGGIIGALRKPLYSVRKPAPAVVGPLTPPPAANAAK